MKKLLTVISITLLCSFITENKNEYWALAGTVNDFAKLKGALMKDTVDNKELIKWIDTKLFKINPQK